MRPETDRQPPPPKLDLRHRADPATLPERMEEPCTYEELRGCLRELDRVNAWTLGFRPTRHFVRQIARRSYPQALRVLEVGYGSGTGLRLFGNWAARQRLRVRLTGIDLDPMTARIAAEFDAAARRAARPGTPAAEPAITWLTGDALTEPAAQGQDVVFSTLVAHHMRDEQIVSFLRWMEANTSVGWFINDLQRSANAYRTFAVMSRLLRWHPFIQTDGLISIRRAFRREDWLRLLAAAGIPAGVVRLHGGAPGRLCLTRLH